MTRARALDLAARISAAVALAGGLGTLLASGPYLSASAGVEPWLAVWAVGLFGLLMYVPFVLHRRNSSSGGDRDRRWELAVVGWGAVALAGIALFGLVLWVGPGPAAPLGALALTGLLECGLIAAAVAAVVLLG